MENYKKVTCKKHPKSNELGQIREHVLVAESMINRYLKEGETVHHKDENKRNNSKYNIIIFATIADHSRFHKGEYDRLYIDDEWIWHCVKKEYLCKKCSKKISKVGICSKCSHKERRKVKNRPKKEELYNLLRNKSFLSVGRIYGVSDNAIRKWCKIYNIPSKASYYKIK